ncbi:LLM class flavin-dependent oxidoreductase [Novosphingobium panipatense]|uniref:LLM class flavin-dependent oxidoreductase n=1 Tax=Novosphingobium TaxID=165696 RepID=UPI000CDA7E33|nr:LLM class flavin-dependent oxidoreductase [Novosphingobium sp. HII-3]
MPLEILGVLLHRNASETSPGGGPAFDVETIETMARAFDENDFDRVLILQNSFAPDPFAIASYAAAVTRRLAFMVAHRPGFVAPTMAARMFATLDNLSGGRAGVHVITGANDTELQCDGDFRTKDERYHRSAEYVDIMRRVWTCAQPFDHDGEYYRFTSALSELKPVRGTIPVYWGGSSPLALEKGAEVADVYAVGGLKPLDQMADTIAHVRGAWARTGRSVRIQTSARVILGDTEEQAWKAAAEVVDALRETALDQQRRLAGEGEAMSTGMRLEPKLATTRGGFGRNELEAIAQGRELLDKRLWTGITKASISFSTPMLPPALVGTAEQVADAMMDYYAMGISGFLIRGFDLLGDIALHGRNLIPILRRRAAEHDAQLSEPASAAPFAQSA